MFSYLNPFPHLPHYQGRYKVGSTEFEIPVSEIGPRSSIPDTRVTTVKFRLFYPTDSSSKSKRSIPWLPEPKKQWNQAYALFMGISESKASWLSHLPSILNFATIPAVQNAPLLKSSNSEKYPTVVFSHGLGGNFNVYSSLVGSLASCGVICVVPEHRDGSAPISFIKSSREKIETTVPYEKLSHSPSVEVLNARNAMLRVRLWELDLVYNAITQIDHGKQFTNLADTVSESDAGPSLENVFDLESSRVSWIGHSFGAATIVQFVKSVYYRESAPQVETTAPNSEGWNLTPLFAPDAENEVLKQITSSSPIGLLDLWTMPLTAKSTNWLWEKPLPCYDRQSTSSKPSVVSIMSAEFCKWPEVLTRNRSVLSAHPAEAYKKIKEGQSSTASLTNPATKTPSEKEQHQAPPKPSTQPTESDLQEPVSPELTPVRSNTNPPASASQLPSDPITPTRTPSPSPPPPSSTSATVVPSAPQSTTITINTPGSSDPHLYQITNSAHLNQSDFGLLFPKLAKYLMKAQDPEEIMRLNVRALLSLMRNAGLIVEDIRGGGGEGQKHMDDPILEIDGLKGEKGEERWKRIQLV